MNKDRKASASAPRTPQQAHPDVDGTISSGWHYIFGHRPLPPRVAQVQQAP
jgi:hypothetical protein